MSGINWTSYRSNGSLDAGFTTTIGGLYNNSITFFNSSPTSLANGTLTTLQVNSGNNTFNPSFSTFGLGSTDNIAIKFTGYFKPNQTGNWTIYLGPGATTPCDDFGILFLGVPDTTITPVSTYTTISNVPSSTLPFIANIYSGTTNSKTVSLQAGTSYPILIYYNQGRFSYNFGLGFSLNGGSIITDFTAITTTTYTPPYPCFKKDSKILTNKGYILIQDLKKGDLVKTALNGYVAIDMIGSREIYHACNKKRIKQQLYKCSTTKYPELFEDLILTGCHSILTEELSDEEKEKSSNVNGDIYITDNKFRLPACVDERTSVYEIPGDYTIYHLALENDDYYMNYGIYANGLLVETSSKRYMKEHSGMVLIE